jgi:hypothetical protein
MLCGLVGRYLPPHIVLQPQTPTLALPLPWEPQISHVHNMLSMSQQQLPKAVRSLWNAEHKHLWCDYKLFYPQLGYKCKSEKYTSGSISPTEIHVTYLQ